VCCSVTRELTLHLLERRDIEHVRPERGRFRTFLLASVKHFLLNEAARDRAAKRGGGVPPIPLAFDEAEGRYQFEPADEATPETLYERRWALTLLERVIAAVQAKWQQSGRRVEFDVLKASLLGEGPPGGYAAAAERLGTTAGAVKTAVHRLRKAFRAELRAAIAETVSDHAEIDEELKYLERALGA
jgi:RNA polymerase sigma-70 factor (ECF subfamily)